MKGVQCWGSQVFPYRGHPGRAAKAEVDMSWSLGSPYRGRPGRIAEAKVVTSWYVWRYLVLGCPGRVTKAKAWWARVSWSTLCRGCPIRVTADKMWCKPGDLECYIQGTPWWGGWN